MAVPEWLARAWEPAAPYAERLAVWRGYEQDLQTLLIYAVGIAVYTALVFAFYQSVSKRDLFRFKIRPKGAKGALLRVFEAGLVMPVLSFLYFGVLALSLFVLAKTQSTPQILLLAMSVIVGIRVTTYLTEGAAVDLAKMLPLALLGVLIVDPSYASLETTWGRFGDLPALVPLLSRYFLLFIALEATLQTGRAIWRRMTHRRGGARRPTKSQLIDNASSRNVPVAGPERSIEREL